MIRTLILCSTSVCLAVSGGFCSTFAADNSNVRYIAARKAETGFTPKVHWLPLSTSPPAILLGGPPQAGGTRRYALLRYGTHDSRQIVLVLDEQDDGAARLYVDRSRTGHVHTDDLVTDERDRWEVAMESQIPREGQPPEVFSREIEIRKSAAGDALGVATIGYLEGAVMIGGGAVAARRVDANGNGLFADAQDRIWLDLDADDKWDPFAEQFPFAPTMQVAGKRYAVRSDLAGGRLAFEEITGTGMLHVQLAAAPAGVAVRRLEVALMGEDGSAYAASADGEAIEAPPGRYAVRSICVVLFDELWQRQWRFVFTRTTDPQAENWHEVKAGQTVTIDPVGKLRLTIEGSDLEKRVAAGRQVTVEPRLYTQDGLLINACDIDGQAPTSPLLDAQKAQADIELCLGDGTIASSYQSGFA
jgi:hypothetical protein